MNDSTPVTGDAEAETHAAQDLTALEQSDFGPIFSEAVALVRREGRVSLDSLQRHFGIGHCRAIRMADAMERLGVIPPQLLVRQRVRGRPLAA